MRGVVHKSLLVLLTSLVYLHASGWGRTGHRAIGYIAYKHLTPAARERISKILDGRSIAYVSNWMDDIKSDPAYDYTHPWHYCTIPDGMTYEQAGTPEEGDVIVAIERLTKELETKQFSEEDRDEPTALKFLIHLIGDVHQPLHVGNGKDRGGNNVRVKWFYYYSNLHRVWDEDMIDHEKWGASEMAVEFDVAPRAMIDKWQGSDVRQWAMESMKFRGQIYDIPADHKLGWEYEYKNWPVVELRILQAGIRLAGVLNKLYG